MSIENVTKYLDNYGFADRIKTFEVSSATVELASLALGVEGARIAKSMSFKLKDKCIIVVTAGDEKINNAKFKGIFHEKAKMVGFDEVEELTGHPVGGVCPFDVKDGVEVYLDISLKRFDIVYPAAGTPASAVKLTPQELFECSNAKEWIDVCKEKE